MGNKGEGGFYSRPPGNLIVPRSSRPLKSALLLLLQIFPLGRQTSHFIAAIVVTVICGYSDTFPTALNRYRT